LKALNSQRREHRVHLSDSALELVGQLRRGRTGNAMFVFPGDVPDAPIATLRHIWHFVRERAQLPAGSRLYDCRHSFASIGASHGLSLIIIGRLLGHTQARTTQRYAQHLSDDPMREAANRIGDAITGGKRD
jgi:integrase